MPNSINIHRKADSAPNFPLKMYYILCTTDLKALGSFYDELLLIFQPINSQPSLPVCARNGPKKVLLGGQNPSGGSNFKISLKIGYFMYILAFFLSLGGHDPPLGSSMVCAHACTNLLYFLAHTLRMDQNRCFYHSDNSFL